MAQSMIHDRLLSAVADLAIRAGREILDVYATGCEAQIKADTSPVTEADHRAEAVILAGLANIASGIPVVAEEECAAGRIPATQGSFFLVDPLDGTREFLARNGEFTVNIALIESGVPVLGVVHAPALGVLYAGSGREAFKAQVADGVIGEAHPIHVRSSGGLITAVGSRSHGSQQAVGWLGRFPGAEFVSAGSSLKFGLLAEGVADLYPRFGRTMEWDTAAGDAVLRAAGGTVTSLDGKPLTYNKREGTDVPFANPDFLAFGDPRLLATALDENAVAAAS